MSSISNHVEVKKLPTLVWSWNICSQLHPRKHQEITWYGILNKKNDVYFFGVLQQPSWNHFFHDLTPKNRLALPYRYFSRIFSKVRTGSDILMLSKNLSNSPAARIALLRLERNHHALASRHHMKKGFRSSKEHQKDNYIEYWILPYIVELIVEVKKNNPLRKRHKN